MKLEKMDVGEVLSTLGKAIEVAVGDRVPTGTAVKIHLHPNSIYHLSIGHPDRLLTHHEQKEVLIQLSNILQRDFQFRHPHGCYISGEKDDGGLPYLLHWWSDPVDDQGNRLPFPDSSVTKEWVLESADAHRRYHEGENG